MNRVNSNQTLFHTMLPLEPRCSPSAGPKPYLLLHFLLQAISSPGSCCAHQAAWGGAQWGKQSCQEQHSVAKE